MHFEQHLVFVKKYLYFTFRAQPLTNGYADGDWSESSEEDHQGRYSPLVAMAMSGTSTKPPTGISPPRAQSPFNKASTPLNTTGGALGTSLNGSLGLQGKTIFFIFQSQNLVNIQCIFKTFFVLLRVKVTDTLFYLIFKGKI